MKPIISVIVPIYNVEQYLNKCIDSIINQTYKHLEIILIDDGSPDNCGVICDVYSKKDSRIQVIHQKNKGLCAARNLGVEISTGDYVAFVDSDDWIHKIMYESLLNEALKHQKNLTNCILIDSNKSTEGLLPENQKSIILDKKELLYNYFKHGFYVMRNLYSKELIKDIRFDENTPFTEDVIFGIDIIERVENSAFFNFPYYIYNVDNHTSVTRTNYNKKTFLSLNANIYLQKKITTIFPDDVKLHNYIKDRIINNCIYHLQNLYLPENAHLDGDNMMKEKSKQTYNENFVFFKNPSVLKTIIRLLNTSQLKYFYRIYFALKK